MPANLFTGDDADSCKNWDACWDALESLPDRDLPINALRAEAARIIDSCRAVTQGRGIERIEERAEAAYRLVKDRPAVGSDEHLNRFRMALVGALSVLRRRHGRQTAMISGSQASEAGALLDPLI